MDTEDDSLAAIVYEVHNTFGERHAYVLPVTPSDGPVSQECAKDFYVLLEAQRLHTGFTSTNFFSLEYWVVHC